MQGLAQRFGRYIGLKKGLPQREEEIYSYGAEVILTTGSFIIASLFVGHLCGLVLETLCFLLAFLPLRSFAGGYHAPSNGACLIVSIGFMLGSFMLAAWLPAKYMILFLLIALGIIFMIAPVIHPNSPHSIEHRNLLCVRVRAIAIGEALIVVLLSRWHPYCASVFAATFIVATLSTLIAAIQKKFGFAEYRR